jgi:hypothetical protein
MHTDPTTLEHLVADRVAELRASADHGGRRTADPTPRTTRAARAGFLASLALGGAVVVPG